MIRLLAELKKGSSRNFFLASSEGNKQVSSHLPFPGNIHVNVFSCFVLHVSTLPEEVQVKNHAFFFFPLSSARKEAKQSKTALQTIPSCNVGSAHLVLTDASYYVRILYSSTGFISDAGLLTALTLFISSAVLFSDKLRPHWTVCAREAFILSSQGAVCWLLVVGRESHSFFSSSSSFFSSSFFSSSSSFFSSFFSSSFFSSFFSSSSNSAPSRFCPLSFP